MIRILLPDGTYNEDRLALLGRLTQLTKKRFRHVKRVYAYLQQQDGEFLEGYLENNKFPVAVVMLTDREHTVLQPNFADMPTYVIEDYDAFCSDEDAY